MLGFTTWQKNSLESDLTLTTLHSDISCLKTVTYRDVWDICILEKNTSVTIRATSLPYQKPAELDTHTVTAFHPVCEIMLLTEIKLI